jgi:hypothetical protein
VRWSLGQIDLAMLGLVVGWLTPAGATLLAAVDDTLSRRTGCHIRGASGPTTVPGPWLPVRPNCREARLSSSPPWWSTCRF